MRLPSYSNGRSTRGGSEGQGGKHQGVLSWRASGDRQISLSASDERAFANFRVKNVVFTGTHFCAVLSMVGERAFVNFRKFVN